jgi:glutathione reductase (NADPH)
MSAQAFDFDLFVIGGGSGGVRAARVAAQSGARVALAEEYRMGGTCVIRGCVPKKFMVYASDYAKKIRQAEGFGYTVGTVSYDHAAFLRAMHAEVDRLSALYMKGQTGAGVTVFEERAAFTGPHTLRLSGTDKEISAAKILIATGGRAWRPSPAELPGVEYTITSDDVFFIDHLPKHMVVAGGGYIAVEFAHIFAGLGVAVTLVYRGERVLNGFDDDVRDDVMQNLKLAGISVVTGTVFDKIEKTTGRTLPYTIYLRNGDALESDCILMAVGRRPNTAGLGCDLAGVTLAETGAVSVDKWSRTSAGHIWAVGDVTDRAALTPVAIREGHAFADTEFHNRPTFFDHSDIATAVFTQPEVGTVGLSEADARAAHGDIDIYKTRFRPMKSVLNGNPVRTLMKIVVRASDQRVLGVHIVGDDAAEIIQAVGIAVKMGATKDDFDRTCALHPSAAEELVTMRTKWTG